MIASLSRLVLAVLTLSFSAAPALAQATTELGRQTLGRPYWHVFIAYAIVVLLIAGWVISIARRLSAIEARLPDAEK